MSHETPDSHGIPARPSAPIAFAGPGGGGRAPESASRPLALRFFAAAMLLSLAGGVLPGVWLLAILGAKHSFGALPPRWVEVHAQFQVLGLLLCFIFGFGYQAFPRFRGMQLRKPGWAKASLPLLVGGILVQAAGTLTGAALPAGRWIATAGALLVLAAVGLYLAVLTITGRQPSTRPPEPGAASHAGYVLSAMAWLLLAALASVPYAWGVSGAPDDTGRVAGQMAWLGSLRDAQLHGLVLLMITGVSLRLVPGFLSLPPDRSSRPVTWLPWLNLAVAGEVAAGAWSAATGGAAASVAAAAASAILLVGVLAVALPLGIFSPGAANSAPRPFLRSAWMWVSVSLGLRALAPAYLALLGSAASHNLTDASRHAFTLGFATMTVMGISSMVVPALTLRPRQPRVRLMWVLWLLNTAVLLRVGGELLADFAPVGYFVAGISGPVALAAFLAWSVPLLLAIGRPLPPAGAA